MVIDYGLQLSVAQASLVLGETSDLSLFSQYNPHGVFIGLENDGYGISALAFVFLGVPLAKAHPKTAGAAGWIFAIGGALSLVLLVVLAALDQDGLDSRFEVMALLLTYLVLISTGGLLSLAFATWSKQAPLQPAPD